MSIVQLTADILLVLDRPANINEAWGVTVPHIPGCFSTGVQCKKHWIMSWKLL